MKRTARLCLAIALAAAGSDAKAEPEPDAEHRVHVLEPVCPARPVDWEAFVGALRVELGPDGFVVDGGPAAPSPISLSIEASPCGAFATAVDIVVESRASGTRLVRTISLADVAPSMRPRTAALASAQLVELGAQGGGATEPSAQAEPAAQGSMVPPNEAPPAAPVPPALTTEASPPVTLSPVVVPRGPLESRRRPASILRLAGVSGEYRRYLTPGTSLFGARALSEWRSPWDSWAFRADVAAAAGSLDAALGHVTLEAFAGAVGGEWISRGTAFAVALGPLVEVGYAHARGQAAPPVVAATGGRPTAATLLLVSVRARVAGDVWSAIELDGGAELAGLRALAGDRAVGVVAGPLIAARFVLAYAP